jgi:hypothetical protein
MPYWYDSHVHKAIKYSYIIEVSINNDHKTYDSSLNITPGKYAFRTTAAHHLRGSQNMFLNTFVSKC